MINSVEFTADLGSTRVGHFLSLTLSPCLTRKFFELIFIFIAPLKNLCRPLWSSMERPRTLSEPSNAPPNCS